MNVQILSPRRPLARVKAKSVRVPGALGAMEILPGHAPLVSEMDIGYLRVGKTADSRSLRFFVVGGYVEVHGNDVTVLANIAETPEEIDKKRAEDARRRAEERLAKKEAHTDMNRAQAALLRALARLQFVDTIAKEKDS